VSGDWLTVLCCNQELASPASENILGGTCSYFSKKNPTLERNNQDSLGFIANKNQALLVVADGIGGHRMGDEASKIAVQTILEFCKKNDTLSIAAVYEAILQANKKVRALNVGAGTTICTGLIMDNTLAFISTGDSLGVHFSGQGNTKTQTIDQSSAGLAKLSHLFSDEEIENKDGGNQLIYAIGDEHLQLSITGPMEINQRDHILLSSDGLTANLSESEITQFITTGPVNNRVGQLIDLSAKKMQEDHGHPDDLSIILLAMGRSDSTEDLAIKEKEA